MPPMRRVRRQRPWRTGDGGALTGRSICYSGHRSRAPKTACGPGPAGADYTRGAIAFPAERPAGLTAIVPKYTMVTQAENRKNRHFPAKNRECTLKYYDMRL